jgi:P27 family predicted phage terminase small subunit
MARAAKTIRQHLLQGTIPHSKPDKPSVYQGGRPKRPKHLSPVGWTEFKRLCGILERRGTATEGDYVIAALYGEVYARWISVKAAIGDQYMVTTTVTNNHGVDRTVSRLNPLLKVLQADESRLQSLAKSLGLTPLDREKVKQTRPNEEEEIIPGSMADLYPQLVGGKKREPVVRTLTPEELAVAHDEESKDEDGN